jgi:nitric oxide reductase subunit B
MSTSATAMHHPGRGSVAANMQIKYRSQAVAKPYFMAAIGLFVG